MILILVIQFIFFKLSIPVITAVTWRTRILQIHDLNPKWELPIKNEHFWFPPMSPGKFYDISIQMSSLLPPIFLPI